MFGRSALFICGLIGAAVFCQAPEITQQYRQRLGGAVEELRVVVARFDDDAARFGMGRQEALIRYRRSPDEFLKVRGGSMAEALARFEHIEAQQRELQQAGLIERPFLVARNPDEKIISETLSNFRPAIPTTPEGGFFGLVGFFVTRFLLGTLLGVFGLGGRRARRA